MGIFVDTGFYFALLATKDAKHSRAQFLLNELSEGIYGQIYTSDFVFDESMTLINVRTKGERTDLLEKVKSLFLGEYPIAKMIMIESQLFDEIANLQIKITKKDDPLSFTDCSNIILCQKRKLFKIISFDGHYKGILTQIQ